MSEHEQSNDYKAISFKLIPMDKFILWYAVIGTILMIIIFDHMTTFEGVWIGGMPKSAFYIVVCGVINLIIAAVSYYGYKSYYDKLTK